MVCIKKICKIKEFASFEDFAWDDTNLNDFKKYNIFYGMNGSGKTTLSNLFYFLNDGQITVEGNYQDRFEIELDDDSKVTSIDMENNLKDKICVYNDLFIKDFIDFELTNSKKPIIYFSAGKDNKKQRLKKDLFTRYIQKVDAKISDLDIQSDLTTKEKSALFTLYQDDVVNLLNTNRLKFKIDKAAEKLNVFSNSIASGGLLSQIAEDELERSPAIFNQEEKNTPNYSLPECSNVTQNDINALKIFLLEPMIRKNISDIKDELLEWLEDGLAFQNNSEKCIFCGQVLSSDVWLERISYIKRAIEKDDEYLKKEDAVNILVEKVKLGVSSNLKFIDKSSDFYENYKLAFDGLKNHLIEVAKKIDSMLMFIMPHIEEKQKDKKISIDISKIKTDDGFLLYDSLIYYINEFDIYLQKMKQLYQDNKDETDLLATQKIKLLNAVAEHIASNYAMKLIAIRDRETFITHSLRKYNNYKRKIKTRQQANLQELADTKAPIEEINSIVTLVMGKNKFQFIYDEALGQYKIQRIENGVLRDAINLSEGERNIISFAFFITYIKEKIEDNIIVIDDPVSSLDNDYFFNILNLILGKRLIQHENVKQIFILTHNFFFFRLLRKNIKGKKLEDVDATGNKKGLYCKHFKKDVLENKQIYQIVKNKSCSNICPPSLFLLKYNSEYLSLIESIVKYKNNINAVSYDYSDAVSILNMMRRVMEIFLENKYPITGGSDFHNKFKAILEKIKKVDCFYILHILNLGSHGDNSVPALDYSRFENFEKLTTDYFDCIRLIDEEFYNDVILKI